MTTFEIIKISEALKMLNNNDAKRVGYDLESGYRIDAGMEEDGYWSVYLDEYFEEDGIWESAYVSTHSVYSMTGAIAEAINNLVEMEKEFIRNK